MSTTKQAFCCISHLIKGGWKPNLHDVEALSGAPLAQLFTYSPDDEYCFSAINSLDAFMATVTDLGSQYSFSLEEPALWASTVSKITRTLKISQSKEDEADLAIALTAYMVNTLAGKQYFEKAIGLAFCFVAILYPANAEKTEFLVRPYIIGAEDPLSVKDVMYHSKRIMDMDRKNGNHEYFQHL